MKLSKFYGVFRNNSGFVLFYILETPNVIVLAKKGRQ